MLLLSDYPREYYGYDCDGCQLHYHDHHTDDSSSYSYSYHSNFSEVEHFRFQFLSAFQRFLGPSPQYWNAGEFSEQLDVWMIDQGPEKFVMLEW